MRSNSVPNVLVTSGNQSALGSGSRITDLAIGQLGVFNYETGFSLSTGSSLGAFSKVIIAVGQDPTGTGSLSDIQRSTGSWIPTSKLRSYNARCYSPSRPKIVNITGFAALCNTEYAIKVEIINQAAFANYGYSTPYYTYAVVTGCCPADCSSGACSADGNQLASLMVTEINKDNGFTFITANCIDYQTTPGTNVVIANTPSAIATWAAANPTFTLGIAITTVTGALQVYSAVNLKYDVPRATDVNISLIENWQCTGATVTTYQDLSYEEGAGYDIAHMEEFAAGANGKLSRYGGASRVLNLTGTAFGFNASAVPTGKYYTETMEYELESVDSGTISPNFGNIVVAIPCADTTTRTSVTALLDFMASIASFLPLATYNAACVTGTDCTVVNQTSDINITGANSHDGESL